MLAQKMDIAIPTAADELDQFRSVYQQFLGKEILYETLSNIAERIFLRSPELLVENVDRGYGGHCVEIVWLLADLLTELGWPAKVINGDMIDYKLKVSTKLSAAYVYVKVGSREFVCDPYYTQALSEVPAVGGLFDGRYLTRRLSKSSFTFSEISDGMLVSEDTMFLDVGIEYRQQVFAERYSGFCPFGVVTPYIQYLRPERRAIYYVPKSRALLAIEGRVSRKVSLQDLTSIEWLGAHFHEPIRSAYERNDAERGQSIAFLRKGIFNPLYTPIEE